MQMFARNERLISKNSVKRGIEMIIVMCLNTLRKVLSHKSGMQ